MLSIVLITPMYRETETPAGLCTAALAHALAEHGHRVHVICAMTTIPRARHEYADRITVHRLETRRASPPLAFALQAAKRVHELSRSNSCDAIECIDTPESLLAIVALREAGVLNAPLIALSVHKTGQHSVLADASITAIGRTLSPTNIPFPLRDELRPDPMTDTPIFVACDAITPEQQQPLLRAFKDSDAPAQGWSLALRTPRGSWSIHERTTPPATNHNATIYLSVSIAAPVAPIHAMLQGHPCLVTNESPIADALPPHLVYNPSDPRALTEALRALIRHPSPTIIDQIPWTDTPSIVHAHERLWTQPPTILPTHERLNLWRTIEHHASSTTLVETIQ